MSAIKGAMTKKALLVEPPYRHRYPSIPLLKLSTYLKKEGFATEYAGCFEDFKRNEYERVLVTTLFTFDWMVCIDAILEAKKRYPRASISVGGPYASLMPEHVEKHTGVKPFVGASREVDECAPDYALIPSAVFDGTSHIFTSRGCPRNCAFCGTRKLEPEMRIIESWKGHLMPESRMAVIHDNNVLAHGGDHFHGVITFLSENRVRFFFDNGFDCRLFEKAHADLLRSAPISQIRFAFDSMSQDGMLQEAIAACKEKGIRASKITVFILYNFNEPPDSAVYRAQEVLKLGARPWAMRYTPLTWLNPLRTYIANGWSMDQVVDFGQYINSGWIRKMAFQEWTEKRCLRRRTKGLSRPGNGFNDIIARAQEEATARGDQESLFNPPDLIMKLLANQM